VCNKHRLKTYRYMRQKYTTAMVRVSKPFMDQVLWPEFNKYSAMFDQLTQEIMNDLISKIHAVNEEDETVIAGELPLAQETVNT
jgi:spore coat protein CotF